MEPREREPFDFSPVADSSPDPSSACLAGFIGGAALIVAGGELLEGVASVFGAANWLGTAFPVIGAVVLTVVGVGFIAFGVYAIVETCS